jgi:hypothetical protein
MRPLHYDLELHLAFLLFQQDSLHVPGLGVFSVRRYGAEIQLPAGLILPPARRLSFAPEAQGDSSVLLDHLCSIEGFSRAEATEATDLCVAEWNRVLDRGDRLNLIGLGSLRRSDHAWVFKASIDANFLAASYGLQPILTRQLHAFALGTLRPLLPVPLALQPSEAAKTTFAAWFSPPPCGPIWGPGGLPNLPWFKILRAMPRHGPASALTR